MRFLLSSLFFFFFVLPVLCTGFAFDWRTVVISADGSEAFLPNFDYSTEVQASIDRVDLSTGDLSVAVNSSLLVEVPSIISFTDFSVCSGVRLTNCYLIASNVASGDASLLVWSPGFPVSVYNTIQSCHRIAEDPLMKFPVRQSNYGVIFGYVSNCFPGLFTMPSSQNASVQWFPNWSNTGIGQVFSLLPIETVPMAGLLTSFQTANPLFYFNFLTNETKPIQINYAQGANPIKFARHIEFADVQTNELYLIDAGDYSGNGVQFLLLNVNLATFSATAKRIDVPGTAPGTFLVSPEAFTIDPSYSYALIPDRSSKQITSLIQLSLATGEMKPIQLNQ